MCTCIYSVVLYIKCVVLYEWCVLWCVQLWSLQVCGAFLSMYDNDRRLADHFGGKLHIGFVTIREKIKLLEVQASPLVCS